MRFSQSDAHRPFCDLRQRGWAVMFVAGLAVVIGSVCPAGAQTGVMLPTEVHLPPLTLRRHNVRVELQAQAAVTTVEQVFENTTDRQLEAKFIFPVPRGAALTKFTMLVNGVEKAGELVEARKARQIYDSIVRRSLDPGLLEYVGQDLIQANIFPIAPRGQQRVTVRFARVADREGDLVHYVYPLRVTGGQIARVKGDMTVTATITGPQPIKTVYSPSHKIAVRRVSETHVEVGFEDTAVALDRDFHLYYAVSEKDVGMSVLTYRPDREQPGYAMMLLTPRAVAQASEIARRDVVMVMDTSGSMAGEKIIQARAALRHCVEHLNEGDRFEVIRFSTDVEPWRNQLAPATADNRRAALKFIDGLDAAGATNIDEALQTALGYRRFGGADRPLVVLFFTDGKPTLGATTQPKAIVANVAKTLGTTTAAGGELPSHHTALIRSGRDASVSDTANRGVRIFTWGVGFDVDTTLLDGLADVGGGVSEYVAPQEDISAKVAAFHHKSSRPVLTDVRLEVVGEAVTFTETYPRTLPDLYAGGQVVVLSRYTGAGAMVLRLTGRVNGVVQSFVYETDLPAVKTENDFVAALWARRRIGYLLDAIRQHGDNPELVGEVVALSKRHGIQTPYTSWLILEDGMEVPSGPRWRPVLSQPSVVGGRDLGRDPAQPGLNAEATGRSAELARRLKGLADANGAAHPSAAAASPADKSVAEFQDRQRELAQGAKASDGQAGVRYAEFLGQLRKADAAPAGDADQALSRRAGGVTYFAFRGLWVDERFTPETGVTTVKFASPAYFALIDKHPKVVEVLRLGTEILMVTASGKAVLISRGAGVETLSDAELADLFTDKPAAGR